MQLATVTFNEKGDTISTDDLVQIVSRSGAHAFDWVRRDTLVFLYGWGPDAVYVTAKRSGDGYKIKAVNNTMRKVR